MSGAREIVTAAIPCNIVYGRSQAASDILSALTAAGYRILVPGELDHLREREEAAREFVKRHPALSLIDLAEFEAFLKVPAAIRTLTDGGHDA